MTMACETFRPYNPQAKTLVVIEQANAIIGEYFPRGLRMSLRQLFYQFVARSLFANTFQNYKRLGDILCNARDGGLVDWDAIEDRNREVVSPSWWDNPADIIGSAARSYQEDLWATQSHRPVVLIEKAALVGVIEGVCTELRVPYFATIGNTSQPMLYEMGRRFARYIDEGRTPTVLYLGDHDPNGIDMTRDVRDRLELYTREPVEVCRIALTMTQVRQYAPPPNTAKETDSRYAGYVETFGTTDCWELDALPPDVIADLVRRAVNGLIEPSAWNAALRRERLNRKLLEDAAGNWAVVERLLRKKKPRTRG